MNLSRTGAAVALTLLFAAACRGAANDQATAASPPQSAAPPVEKPGVLATCLGKGLCDEFRNKIPATAESSCAKRNGTFSRGAIGCPTNDRLVGVCGESKVTPETTSYWYGEADAAHDDQAMCESPMVGGKWTLKAR